MRCVSTGDLRAYLDYEVLPSEWQRIEDHLVGCPRCQERLAELRGSVHAVGRWLDQPTPTASVRPEAALARVRAKAWGSEHEGRAIRHTDIRRKPMRSGRNGAWRPAMIAVIALATMIGIYSFGPTQAIARQLLSVFRVRRFAVIEVSPNEDQMQAVGRVLEENLFVGEPDVIEDGPEVAVGSIEEAREAAGFEARLPEYLPGGLGENGIYVKGYSRAEMRFTGEGLAMILDMADMDPTQIPADLDEGIITVDIPAVVRIENQWGNHQVLQVWQPTVEYPDGVDPSVIGEAGLRLMGIPKDQARRISQSIDWTSTVLLPVPSEITQVHELEIGGEPAVLLLPRNTGEGDAEPRALMWQKDDVVYLVTGHGSREQIVQTAESMF